eukprot:5545981-Amphidinium_carterae.1
MVELPFGRLLEWVGQVQRQVAVVHFVVHGGRALSELPKVCAFVLLTAACGMSCCRLQQLPFFCTDYCYGCGKFMCEPWKSPPEHLADNFTANRRRHHRCAQHYDSHGWKLVFDVFTVFPAAGAQQLVGDVALRAHLCMDLVAESCIPMRSSSSLH